MVEEGITGCLTLFSASTEGDEVIGRPGVLLHHCWIRNTDIFTRDYKHGMNVWNRYNNFGGRDAGLH